VSFRVSWGVVSRLGFRDGVSASYSYFRRVANFDISHTAAVWLSPAFNLRTAPVPARFSLDCLQYVGYHSLRWRYCDPSCLLVCLFVGVCMCVRYHDLEANIFKTVGDRGSIIQWTTNRKWHTANRMIT